MAAALHRPYRFVVEAVLEADLVGDELVVQARLGEGVNGAHVAVDQVDDALHRGCCNATAACCACHEIERAVGVGDNHGRDGGQRSFARLDVVGRRWDVTELIGGPGDREVCKNQFSGRFCVLVCVFVVGLTVHFIVHNDPRLRNHHQAAKVQVDRGGQGNRKPGAICRRDMRCSRSSR